jgi:tetratricopeptide (TPR) repeat protein
MAEITEDELSFSLRPLWLKALSAVQMNNLDYAVSLLQAVLKGAPGFLEGRKILRKCEIQIHAKLEKKKNLFVMSGGGMSLMKLASQAKKDPEAGLPLIEKELEKDPISDAANELLFDTALRLELFETAAFALETIRRHNPSNVKLLHKLAEHYLALELPTKAAEVYNDIIKQAPTDSSAIKGAKDASARASMKKQRWDENTSMRDLMRDAEANEELEKAARSGLTREQLEARRDNVIEKYNSDPNNIATAKELAALYEQLEDWSNAYTFFHWAHSLSNGDIALSTKSAQMRDRALEAELKRLKSKWPPIRTTWNSRCNSHKTVPCGLPSRSPKRKHGLTRTLRIPSSVSNSATPFTAAAITPPPSRISSRRPATRTSAPRCCFFSGEPSGRRTCSTSPSNSLAMRSPISTRWTAPRRKSFTKRV